jgi:hypothetical protein
MTTRFILENLATLKLGYALPLYDSDANLPRTMAVGNLSNADLLEIVVAGGDDGTASSRYDKPEYAYSQAYVRNQIFPLRFRKSDESDFWEFPLECIFSLKQKNIIVKRAVAKNKGRGSVKESFTKDDVEITIQGLFFDRNGEYPDLDLKKLRSYVECGEAIQVECPLFEIYDITHIVIEDCDLPFTKGENIQGFALKCVSDDLTQLLLEDNITVL